MAGIEYPFFTTSLGLSLIVIIALWELIWKGIALWKCGRNNQLAWFVVILIFNTVGILPIVYLLFFQKNPWVRKGKAARVKTKPKKKRK